MSNYKPTKFLKQHREFFKDYTFKFEGLKPKIKKDYIRVVKDLGANVSEDALYTFVDISYFENHKNEKHTDFYNINYILHSIEAEKPLDIELYRFDSSNGNRENYFSDNENVCHENFTCNIPKEQSNMHAKLLKIEKRSPEYNADSNLCYANSKLYLHEFENQTVVTQNEGDLNKNYETLDTDNNLRHESQKSLDAIDNTKHNTIHNISSMKRSLNTNDNMLTYEITSNKSVKRIISSSEDESPVRKNFNKVAKKIRSSSTKPNGRESPVDNLDSSQEDLNLKEKKIQEKLNTNISKNSKKINSIKKVSGWISTDNNSVIASTSKGKREKADLSSDISILGISDDSDNSDADTKVFSNGKNWWEPHKISEDELCTMPSCSFATEPHVKHSLPSRMLSMTEKRILLKYLITTKNIHNSKGIKVWQQMHKDGFLKHRSVETLRNCLRRTILPNIEFFELPKYILSQFLTL